MKSQDIKALKLDGDGIFEFTTEQMGEKFLIYNKDGVKYFQCQLKSGGIICKKSAMIGDIKDIYYFCMDPKFSDLIENMNEEDMNKNQELTGKKLKNFVFSQMKEYKVHCMDTGVGT